MFLMLGPSLAPCRGLLVFVSPLVPDFCLVFLQGNMEKIKNWAISLQDVLLQMAKQMKVCRTHNSHG